MTDQTADEALKALYANNPDLAEANAGADSVQPAHGQGPDRTEGVSRPKRGRGHPEDDFQRTVIELAQTLGWRVAHFRSVQVVYKNRTAWQTPVQADGRGFPDLLMLREGRQLVAELKSEAGELSQEQAEWLAAFQSGHVEAYVWKPSDYDTIEGVLQ